MRLIPSWFNYFVNMLERVHIMRSGNARTWQNREVPQNPPSRPQKFLHYVIIISWAIPTTAETLKYNISNRFYGFFLNVKIRALLLCCWSLNFSLLSVFRVDSYDPFGDPLPTLKLSPCFTETNVRLIVDGAAWRIWRVGVCGRQPSDPRQRICDERAQVKRGQLKLKFTKFLSKFQLKFQLKFRFPSSNYLSHKYETI